jgi:TRAP-type C4-dicarboxylate transport system substrate-binding protein
MLIASRAYDQLPVDGKQAVAQASARVIARLNEIGREGDEQLLGSLFEKQGLKRVQATPTFRAEFFAAAQAARDRLGRDAVADGLLERVLAMLADFRAMHRTSDSER